MGTLDFLFGGPGLYGLVDGLPCGELVVAGECDHGVAGLR
jgi:hypothetical protein